MKWTTFPVWTGLMLLTGCATTITSVPLSPQACKDAAAHTIPYYLPRPYLLVTRNFAIQQSVNITKTSKQTELAKTTENQSETSTSSIAPPASNADVIAWQIIYLPDLDQKYGLRFKRGWGQYESTITLVDGWKLAGINITAEAQAADTISAIGSAVKEIVSSVVPGIPMDLEAMSTVKSTDEPRTPSTRQEQQTEFWLFDFGDLKNPRLVFHWSIGTPNAGKPSLSSFPRPPYNFLEE